MSNILFYGDSNTWGFCGYEYGHTRHSREIRFPGRVQNMFPEHHVMEEGLPGRNISFDDPIEFGRNGRTYLPIVLSTHDPIDLIIIMLGTNDTKCYLHNTVFSIQYAMGKMIEMIQDLTSWDGTKKPEILLVAPPPIVRTVKSPYFGMFDENSEILISKVPKEYQRLSHNYHCHFLNAYEVCTPRGLDGVHLGPEEHELLADAIGVKIREII